MSNYKSLPDQNDAKLHTFLGLEFRTSSDFALYCNQTAPVRNSLANRLRRLANAYIAEFIDADEDAVNSIFIPENQFVITGHLIKVAGDDPGVGVFFVPADDPAQAVKVTRIAENSSAKIIGISPDTGHAFNRIEIRTQYTGSGDKFLKAPRVITSGFVLEHG
jgi:hypothetical protein